MSTAVVALRLVVPAAILVAWPVTGWLIGGLRARRLDGRCAHCAYDRSGLAPGAVCPECGLTPRQAERSPGPAPSWWSRWEALIPFAAFATGAIGVYVGGAMQAYMLSMLLANLIMAGGVAWMIALALSRMSVRESRHALAWIVGAYAVSFLAHYAVFYQSLSPAYRSSLLSWPMVSSVLLASVVASGYGAVIGVSLVAWNRRRAARALLDNAGGLGPARD